MLPLKINVGDSIILKKSHPCGNSTFKVERIGSDARIVCEKCGHELVLDRLKLEKSIKNIIKKEEKNG